MRRVDEDGDGRNDGCDLCPADPEATDTDTDGDGIGDVCDPHPATPTDQLVVFDGFQSDLHYTTTGAGWFHAGGQYQQSQAQPGSRAQLGISATHQIAVDAIVASIDETTTGTAGISITLADNSIIDCVHAKSSGGVLQIAGKMTTTMPLALNGALHLQLRENSDGSFDCKGDNLHGSVATAHLTQANDGLVNQYGVSADKTHAVFDSVTVYGVGN